MTAISTNAPNIVRRVKLPRLSFPKLRIGALLAAIPSALADAFKMAYVDPYISVRPLRVVPDEDLEGRDPNW